MPSPAGVYATELYQEHRGFPLWFPERPEDGPIQIGDVGFLHRGRFIRLFNATGRGTQRNGVPDGFKPLRLPELIDRRFVDPSDGIISSSNVRQSRKLAVEAGASIPNGVGIDTTFEVNGSSGAILMIDCPAVSETVVATEAFSAYMKGHLTSWVDFARDSMQLGLEEQELLFVTGHVMATSCHMLVFYGGANRMSIRISGTPRADLSMVDATTSMFGPKLSMAVVIEEGRAPERLIVEERHVPDRRYRPYSVSNHSTQDLKQDQCIFLYACRAKPRLGGLLGYQISVLKPDKTFLNIADHRRGYKLSVAATNTQSGPSSPTLSCDIQSSPPDITVRPMTPSSPPPQIIVRSRTPSSSYDRRSSSSRPIMILRPPSVHGLPSPVVPSPPTAPSAPMVFYDARTLATHPDFYGNSVSPLGPFTIHYASPVSFSSRPVPLETLRTSTSSRNRLSQSSTSKMDESRISTPQVETQLRPAIGKDEEAFNMKSSEVTFDVNNPIGRGGFGQVFKGDWNGTTVAVKRMHAGSARVISAAQKKAMRHEIKLWSTLHHPHVLTFYGACLDVEVPFLVMRYCPFGDVSHYLTLHPEGNRTRLSHEVAAGLAFLHRKDIVHADVKGANILISEDRHALLTDFGLALKLIDVQTQTSFAQAMSDGRRGTLLWMAPEVLQGAGPDMAADIYSLGLTIWEIFSGEVPFANIFSHNDLVDQVVTYSKRPKRPNRLMEPEQNRMWEIIQSCWVEERSARPTAKAVQDLLRPIALNKDPTA